MTLPTSTACISKHTMDYRLIHGLSFDPWMGTIYGWVATHVVDRFIFTQLSTARHCYIEY